MKALLYLMNRRKVSHALLKEKKNTIRQSSLQEELTGMLSPDKDAPAD